MEEIGVHGLESEVVILLVHVFGGLIIEIPIFTHPLCGHKLLEHDGVGPFPHPCKIFLEIFLPPSPKIKGG